MAFQPYQPFGNKRKTQKTTGANMKKEGAQVGGGIPSPITTQGPIQKTESAAKMAAANQVMNKPIPAAPQMNPIGMGMGGPQPPQGGQPALPFNPAAMADMKNSDGKGMTPLTGEFWNQTEFGEQFGEQLAGTSEVGKNLNDITELIASGGFREDGVDEQGNEIVVEGEESGVGGDLASWFEEMMGQSAEDEAAKVSGDLIRSQRSMMGRGLTGGTAARQSDTFTGAVEGAKERINREKLGAATGLADLEKWQAGFDRQGEQLGKEDERYNKSRLLEAIAIKEDLDLDDDEFQNLLDSLGFDMEDIENISSFGGGDGDSDGLPTMKSEQGPWLAENYESEITEFDAEGMESVGMGEDGGKVYNYYLGPDGKYYRVLDEDARLIDETDDTDSDYNILDALWDKLTGNN